MPQFLNPYNFIPTPPRDREHPELGDRRPAGHHRLHEDLWSGRIGVTMTAVTPLLLPDPAAVTRSDRGHPTFPLRLGPDGLPVIAPTAFKGMLRAAYEAVTASRFGVFGGEDPLAYRSEAGQGLAMVPARVVKHGERVGLCLLLGHNTKTPIRKRDGTWRVPNPKEPFNERATSLMYAAWLPRYPHPLHYEGTNEQPEHREHVWVVLERRAHHGPRFDYDEVVRIGRHGREVVPKRGALAPRQTLIEDAWVCVTGNNMGGKHHERVFFAGGLAGGRVDLTFSDGDWKDVEKRWRAIITGYQETHRRELERGTTQPTALPPGRAWSRHVGTPAAGRRSEQIPTAERQLDEGTLCYVQLSGSVGRGGRVQAAKVAQILPVIIARRLFPLAPAALLDDSLRPARALDELSAADRVFGWVSQDGHGAYRGQLRVSSIRCTATNPQDAVRDFTSEPNGALSLAILGAPKPAQFRFYVAATPAGQPLEQGAQNDEAYVDGRGLRGRKVYLHHRHKGPAHWQPPMAQREHVRTERDNQNRSIEGWVEPGATFTVQIDVTNLSDVELGALLWLLKLPAEHYHRFGGGKPLGFGSVRLDLDPARTCLAKGEAWAGRWSDAGADPATDQQAVDAAQRAFEAAIAGVAAPAIRAFLNAARGHDTIPVYYPRLGAQPGNEYQWFVRNANPGNRHALPALDDGDPPTLER